MLTRTNLTLSALSNRLNLGTRSLVLNTGVNNGTASRIRHSHHDVMRDSMAVFKVGDFFVYPAPPITDPAIPDAPRPASDPASPACASPRSSQSQESWRLSQGLGLGSGRAPSFRSRSAAACTAASATRPRLGRGAGKSIGKAGAAGAARGRTAEIAAFAAIAGS